jgi:hypothetical protein
LVDLFITYPSHVEFGFASPTFILHLEDTPNDCVDVKSAPHAKHTASRKKAGLTRVAESEACQSIFPENLQRMKIVR